MLRSRSAAIPLVERATALRALAGLLRIGVPLRRALTTWHEHVVSEPLRDGLRTMNRRFCLGADSAKALDALAGPLGDDARALQAIVRVVTATGGDAAEVVDGLAGAIEARAAALDAARAAGSGARLSGRMIAALPLAFLPLAPMRGASLLDPAGSLLLVVGTGLALVGMAWIARLTPAPPDHDDPAATLADLFAAVVAGGVDPTAALDAAVPAAPPALRVDLVRSQRLARLGLGWPDALGRCGDPGLRALGGALRTARTLGVPVAATLRSWARRRRVAVEREFEAATRRAAVMMMVPLATCVLPSFLLLAVVPFLRGLASN